MLPQRYLTSSRSIAKAEKKVAEALRDIATKSPLILKSRDSYCVVPIKWYYEEEAPGRESHRPDHDREHRQVSGGGQVALQGGRCTMEHASCRVCQGPAPQERVAPVTAREQLVDPQRTNVEGAEERGGDKGQLGGRAAAGDVEGPCPPGRHEAAAEPWGGEAEAAAGGPLSRVWVFGTFEGEGKTAIEVDVEGTTTVADLRGILEAGKHKPREASRGCSTASGSCPSSGRCLRSGWPAGDVLCFETSKDGESSSGGTGGEEFRREPG